MYCGHSTQNSHLVFSRYYSYQLTALLFFSHFAISEQLQLIEETLI